MVHLERVFICGIDDKICDYTTEKQVFPKSIKSLKIEYISYPFYNEHELSIYNTIDPSYINLCSLTIVSNRMLQNLSFGMPSLQEVEIEEIRGLDESKFLSFLKANPQLKKLETDFEICGEEIIKTVLSFKYLEHLRINGGYLEKLEIENLPSNYSIKHLNICDYSPTINLQIINACINIDTLYTYGFNISKLKRRINILKLIGNFSGLGIINEIDNLKSFNQIHLKYDYSINEEICKYSLDKLNNYKLIRLISKDFIFKLIN
ncbi:hypothetical protein CONCODRAFT_19838 [Conidiobolus coronatus NRRL 28638]|uniref:RNI-like protein n=1 Tax=Conidiobolus coronatus (strain ATCC 28846 / CBS 209.66 / NRRL 28638) TaxID=796925 RepID=A0A137NWF8_CONC2|nr:hypothetical protein CONCODRAFT_19838 [Conidiobolus coronatus NRRL 28638]|eukprot:KXN67116.1 hypothetical protein CONCODRAFT_19838 [Conidiobolus coronatus NRRL 28638]